MKVLLSLFLTFFIHFQSALALTVTHFPGSIGAEVHGMDLSQEMTHTEVDWIKTLIQKRLVVIFRQQCLSAQEQVLLTSRFGDVEIAWDKKNRHPQDCHVHVITNDGAKKDSNYVSSTYFWHWDKSFIRYPTSLSFAYFPSHPQPQGVGTTEFLNTYILYETLPEELKTKVKDLSVVHSYEIMSNLRKQNYEKASLEFKKGNESFPDVVHPLVRIHPFTRGLTLNIDDLSQGDIVGMKKCDSDQLRKSLLEHSLTQKNAFYAHNWQTGDFVIWDNLAVIHRGKPSDPSITRILHRTNISSRVDFEGCCILIGSDLSESELIPLKEQLFSEPLIVDSDLYTDLTSLEADIEALRSGRSIGDIPPRPIIILKGSKWEKSQKIGSWLHIVLFNELRSIPFANQARKIPYSACVAQALEQFCVEHFLIQDAHERLMSGELSSEHLQRKLKIFTSSFKSYTNAVGEFTTARKVIHATVLARAFEKTPIHKSTKEWLKYLDNQKLEKKELNAAVPAPLIFLGGGQGVGKTTFLKRLFSEGIIMDSAVVINSRLFFDSLFQDVPYAHKVILWPYFNDEKKYLTFLITKIALAHNLPVIVDTHILYKDFCLELTNAVREYGGRSIMTALYAPLEICYLREQTSSESILERATSLVYEQLMFHKLFSLNWKEFVSSFDASLLIAQNEDRILFRSKHHERQAFSFQAIKPFLSLGLIDPDELANLVSSSGLELAMQKIQRYNEQINDEKVYELLPEGTEEAKFDGTVMDALKELLL